MPLHISILQDVPIILTTTEMISRNAPFFSRGGCKCTPLLQQELGTVAFRLPLKIYFQERVTAPPATENRAHFQGRVVPSPAPKDEISRAAGAVSRPWKCALFSGAAGGTSRPWKTISRGG